MRKPPITLVLLAAGLIVIGAVLLFKKDVEPLPDYVVASDDGSAELRIPRAALPEDVALETISVKRLAIEADGHLASYELSPDGLQFAAPAELAMKVPLPPQPGKNNLHVPVPVVVSRGQDGAMEQVPAKLALSDDRAQMLITAPVAHFSTITSLSFVTARVDKTTDKSVGASFMIGARLTQDRTTVNVPIVGDPDFTAYVFTGSEWYLTGGRFISSTPAVTPEETRKIPDNLLPAAGPNGKPTYGAVRPFACAQVGDGRVSYLALSDLTIKVQLLDAQGRLTDIDFKGMESAEGDVEEPTGPFRCVAGEVGPGGEVLIGGGGGGDATKDTQRSIHGEWEVVMTTSATRVEVGQAFHVDVTITDVTDRATEGLSAPEKARFRIPWTVWGTWWPNDAIFDRGEVEVKPVERPYGGRVTFQLPLRCKTEGTGDVYFETSMERSKLKDDDEIAGDLPRFSGGMVVSPTVTCFKKAAEQEPQTEPIRFQVKPGALQALHVVGSTSCPQDLGMFTIDGPQGGTWTASGIPDWISMPDSGPFGEVPVRFNCDVSDTSPHKESAEIIIASGGETANVKVDVQLR